MHPGLGWDLGKRVPTLRERSQQPPVSPGCETEQPEGAEWGKRPPRPLGPARGMLGQSREPLCRHELPEGSGHLALSTHSLGLERIFASSSLELSRRISFEGCMSSKGKRLM